MTAWLRHVHAFDSLRFRDYRLLWIGNLTEHAGEQIEQIGRAWLVWTMTGSPAMLGIVLATRNLVSNLLAPVGGLFADRLDRRKVLMATFVLMTITSLLLAFLVYTERIQVWHIIAIEITKGLILVFNHGVRPAITPNLVPKTHLLNALTLETGSTSAARLPSAAFAGWLIVTFGVSATFGMRAIGTAIAFVTAAVMRVPPIAAGARKRSIVKDFAGGFRYVATHRTELSLILFFLVPAFLASPLESLLPIFADEIFKKGASGLGFLRSAEGLGSFAGLLLLASLGDLPHKGKLLFASVFAVGLFLLFFSAAGWFYLALALMACVALSQFVFTTFNNTLLQGIIPDEIRGRVTSLRQLGRTVTPLGILTAGFMASSLGAPLTVAIMGGLCATFALAAFFLLPRVRALE